MTPEVKSTTREDTDDLLSDLRAELGAVTPSPAFTASVRARVEAASPSRTWSIVAWWLTAAAAAAVVVIAVLARRDAPPAVTERRTIPNAEAVASSQAAEPSPQAPAIAGPKTSAAVPARVQPMVAADAAEPRIEVITNQGDVLRSVWARVRGPLSEGKETAIEPTSSSEVRELTVDPIQVDPIVLVFPDPRSSGSSPGTIIRKVAPDATRSER